MADAQEQSDAEASAAYLKQRAKPQKMIGAYEATIDHIKSILGSGLPMRGQLTQIKAAIGANDRCIKKLEG